MKRLHLMAAGMISAFVLPLALAASTAADAATINGFTTSASAASTSVAPGASVALSAVVSSATATTVLVDFEVHGPDGRKAAQWSWDNQAFATGQQRTYTATWQVPVGTAPGAYSLKVGIFSPGWASLRAWNDTAGSVTVQSSSGGNPTATPTLTPTPTSPTPTPTSPPSSGSNCNGIPAYPEVRPENAAANATPGRPLDPAYRERVWKFGPYYDRVNGQGCTGTTEQILEWAVDKWGFDAIGYPDLAKAMAVHETWWRMSKAGDCGSGACQSFGILQVRITTWRGGDQLVKTSTALNADYSMAIVRYYYEGNSWMGAGGAGLRNAIGAYFCGCQNGGSQPYVDKVLEYHRTKPWKSPKQPPLYF